MAMHPIHPENPLEADLRRGETLVEIERATAPALVLR
jgi:hypothetical protein